MGKVKVASTAVWFQGDSIVIMTPMTTQMLLILWPMTTGMIGKILTFLQIYSYVKASLALLSK
jgi:hypothetical protein